VFNSLVGLSLLIWSVAAVVWLILAKIYGKRVAGVDNEQLSSGEIIRQVFHVPKGTVVRTLSLDLH